MGLSFALFLITILVGQIFRAAINQIAKVEHDFQEMMLLKQRAEAADIAKSQVNFIFFLSFHLTFHLCLPIIHKFKIF